IISRRRQTILSVAAVALAVSISLLFTSLGNGSQELLTDIVAEKLPHVTVLPQDDEKYIHLYQGLQDRVSAIRGVKSSSAALSVQAAMSFKDQTRNVRLRGVNPSDEDAIYKISQSMVQGRFSDVLGGKGAVAGSTLAENLEIRMGDRVTTAFPRARAAALPVVGIFDTGTPLDESVAYVSLSTAREFLDEGDVINSLELRLWDIQAAEDVAAQIDSYGYNARSWQENNPEIVRSISVGGFWRGLSIFLVMIIAAFGIAAIMNMLVLEKTRDIGMLLAIGASRSEILRVFVLESGVLGLMGGILGCVLGLVGILLVGSFRFQITAAGREIASIPLVIDPWNFVTYTLLAVLLSILAGAYPAYRASRLDPVEALKGAEAASRTGVWRPRFWEEWFACVCMAWIYELAVAVRHILSNRRGTAFTLLSVGIAVGVIIMSLGLTQGVTREIVASTIEKNPHLYLEPKQDEDYIYLYKTVLSRVWDYPGMAGASPRMVAQGAARHRDNVEGVEFTGVDPLQEEELMNIQAFTLSGEFSDLRYRKGIAFIGTRLAENLELRAGQSFDLVYRNRTARLKVAGLIEKGTVKDYTLVYLPLETAQDLVGQGDVITEIGIRLVDFNQAPVTAARLNQILGYQTSSWQEFSREIARFVGTQSRINLIFYSMILIISAFVISNTTIMIIARRTREVGILMAMGATRRSILKIFLLENLLLGIPGGILGVGIGLFAARLVARYGPSGAQGTRLSFDLEPTLIIYALLFALILNFLAGIYPALWASRLDPVQAIASE
ncbi:MAG: ABC transporter permease, partial [Methanosarcinales archaeon]|nr:ABC transporter permease [Methanosarcinales archaeon]